MKRLMSILLGTVLAVSVVAAQHLTPRDVDHLPSKAADARIAYGTDPLQFGELRLPKGTGPFPVAVVIHGGCWVSTFAAIQNDSALADALRDAGVATWNIEYRRNDNPGGGWPGTFQDVAAAADYLPMIAAERHLDLSRVVAVGHSAGAHLALWLAARHRLPIDSELYSRTPLPLNGVVALAGPGDLRGFTSLARTICGAPVVEQLLGGTPQDVPSHYSQGSPFDLLPFGVPHVLIVGSEDPVMPPAAREAYLETARKAGDRVELIVIPGASHHEPNAPTSDAWPAVRGKVLELLGTPKP